METKMEPMCRKCDEFRDAIAAAESERAYRQAGELREELTEHIRKDHEKRKAFHHA